MRLRSSSMRWIFGLSVAASAALLVPAASSGQSAVRERERERVVQPHPSAYGTSSITLVHVLFSEFSPANSSDTYTAAVSPTFLGRSAPGGTVFYAYSHIPSGAMLRSFELDYCDVDPLHHIALNSWIATSWARGARPSAR